MKKLRKMLLLCAVALTSALTAMAANTIQTVEQVTEGVTVSGNVDYVITSNAPFTVAGSVNITNTDHAVVIIRQIKPSLVIKNWLENHVFINGEQAKNNVNCQVKMYAQGAIIMPYAKGFKPLTVYSDKNFAGESVNDFGLENTSGYMNTLSDAKLNNKIRSFKLKRGYMVTFSTRPQGRGYSRCFIADTEDLELASLPAVLDGKISSYRVFQWYDCQKKGVGSDTRASYVSLVNGSWCYDWGVGLNLQPDIECVPNHIYEDWPSSAACGSVTYSCHMKTNNEPGNSADDHPQTVDEILANWENLMRTGLRLCSESSHDGSMNHLKAFIDSIDARGWRCDILDLHCYWPSGTFNNLTWYSDNYGKGRPIWISEWVWGASWNNNGAFNVSNRGDFYGNQDNTYNGTKPILDVLNSNDRVERYAYWNSEANCSKIYNGTELSKLGKYYAEMEPGIGYKKKNEFIPRNPPQKRPSDLKVTFDPETKKAILRWHDYNGEYNQSMVIQRKEVGASTFTDYVIPEQMEAEANYSDTLDASNGDKFRVRIVDLNGKEYTTNEATAVDNSLGAGSEVILEGKTLYMGGNMIANANFDYGLLDWTNAKGEPLSQPFYQAVPEGGFGGGAYLQCYGAGTTSSVLGTLSKDAETVRKHVLLKENASYYVSLACSNTNGKCQRITTSANTSEGARRLVIPATTAWAMQSAMFTVTNDTNLYIRFSDNAGTAQVDNVSVCELFETREAALANALECIKHRAEVYKQFNVSHPALNTEIDNLIATGASYSDIEQALDNALIALSDYADIEQLKSDADMVVENRMPGYTDVAAALTAIETADAAMVVSQACHDLTSALKYSLTYNTVTDKISTPSFADGKTTGWTVKAGTYTGGDQKATTKAGKTCWNAWWSTPASGGSNTTLAIKQELTGLPAGLYALECKATTEHYCESDQHAFLTVGGKTVVSQPLPAGLLDLPSVASGLKWQTLSTPYLYVNADDVVTIGFQSSKEGAIDNAWHSYGSPTSTGDKREGWWCATDFALRQVPMVRKAVVDNMRWGVVCLPQIVSVPEGITLYEVAGITADSTRICLKEAENYVAGTPYVYYTTLDEAIFFETGKAVTSPRTFNGLRGIFTTKAKYPAGSFRLVGDRWEYNTTMSSDVVEPNSAYISSLANLQVLDNDWNGAVLFTRNLVSEQKVEDVMAGVEEIEYLQNPNAYSPLYNVAGQRVGKNARGVLISKGKKVIR